MAERAIEAARATFSDVSEKEGSTYHVAPGLTPAETWLRVTEELGRVLVLAMVEGKRDRPLSVRDVDLIHRAIFAPVFGDAALSYRALRHERVQYPVVLGTPEHPRYVVQEGSAPRSVEQKVRKTLRQFETRVAALAELAAREEATLRDAVLPPVRLYGRIIGIHPWLDGNGRTAWVLLSYALQRCGLLEVALRPTSETRLALGQAIAKTGSRDYVPMVDIVEDIIRRSQA